MKKYKYCLTTRFDVYEFDNLKQLIDKMLPIQGLLGVRCWRKEA